MLTIIAWLIFIPALIWNIVMLIVIIIDTFDSKSTLNWKNPKNFLILILSLFILLVPGVYLFGVW